MAGTITYDIEGSTFRIDVDGESWTRRYYVQGLENGPDLADLYVEILVLTPNVGTPAPAPVPNQFVRSIDIERVWCEDPSNPGSTWSAIGTLLYTTPTRVGGVIGEPDDNGPGVLISGSSSIVEVETDTDVAGAQITTSYDNATQAHKASTFQVARTIDFQRLESTRPDSRKNNVEGRLNDALWNGYAAKTVLLASMDWSSDDGGVSWLVAYSFSIRPDWTVRAVHDDPFFPGNPIPETDPNWTAAAVATRDVIPTADFSQLNITL